MINKKENDQTILTTMTNTTLNPNTFITNEKKDSGEFYNML